MWSLVDVNVHAVDEKFVVDDKGILMTWPRHQPRSHEEYCAKWSWIWSELIISTILSVPKHMHWIRTQRLVFALFAGNYNFLKLYLVGREYFLFYSLADRIENPQIHVLNMGPFHGMRANKRYRLQFHLESALCLLMCRFHNRLTFSPYTPHPYPLPAYFYGCQFRHWTAH